MGSTRRIDYCFKLIEEKLLKPTRLLDNLITQNLRDSRIITRPGSNGLWCFALLPAVLVLYSLLYDVSQAYKLAACLSIGLLFYGILFNLFISISCLVLTQEVGGGCVVSGMIASTLVYNTVKQDFLFIIVLVLPSVFFYSALLRRLLAYQKTFTIGEAVIVAQSLVISIIVIMAKTFCNLDNQSTEVDFVSTVVLIVLSTVGFIVTALFMLTDKARTLKNLITILIGAGIFVILKLFWAFRWNTIILISRFFLKNEFRVYLLASWVSLVAMAVCVLVWRARRKGKATTAARKSFHVLAAVVFASGILLDLELLELMTGVGFGVLILVEALRKSDIEPISSAVQSAFHVYIDEKDSGAFVLTPLYLYCGLGAGLLAPRGAGALERLAGVLAVGVGDSAASWFGSRYGECKWSGQSRTMEGTLFNILSQILIVYCLGVFDLMDCKNAVIRTAVAATASSLVEAKTDQIDNLILPLITLIAFQPTYLIS